MDGEESRMKSLLMGHITGTEYPSHYFETYKEEYYRKQGVFYGLWAWRNVLKMDTFFGPITENTDTKFLDNYDIVFVVGIKEMPASEWKGHIDGYNRCGWLRQHYPHLKTVLISDLSQSFYQIRQMDNPWQGSNERIREQVASADIFLQLVWAYMDELREFWHLDNIYSIEPVDFEEYKYWIDMMPKYSRARYRIATSRHNENSHVNLSRLLDTCRYVKSKLPESEFRFFSLCQPQHLNLESYRQYQWTFHEFFTDIIPFQIATEHLSALNSCGIFMDNVACSSAGPRLSFSASVLKIPSVFNTGLAEHLYPELAVPPVKHITESWNNDLWYQKIHRLLTDEYYYQEMSELCYQRIWEQCRFDSVRNQLFNLLKLKEEGN